MNSKISIHALRKEGDCRGRHTGSRILYFYPRPPRGGRLIGRMENFQKYIISIHALRGEGDVAQKLTERMEKEFLSTPSAGRATRLKATKGATTKYFYPRPPRGGRLKGYLDKLNAEGISIHALRKEGDPAGVNPTRKGEHFYPRPPQGGRPNGFYSLNGRYRISIHALRKEGDNSPAGGKVAI